MTTDPLQAAPLTQPEIERARECIKYGWIPEAMVKRMMDTIDHLKSSAAPPASVVSASTDPQSVACESAMGYPAVVHSKPCSWPACDLSCKGRAHRLSACRALKAASVVTPGEVEQVVEIARLIDPAAFNTLGSEARVSYAPARNEAKDIARAILAAGYAKCR